MYFWAAKLLCLVGWKLAWESFLLSMHRGPCHICINCLRIFGGKSLSFTFIVSSNLTVQCKTPPCLFLSLLFKLTSWSNNCNREEGVIWSPTSSSWTFSYDVGHEVRTRSFFVVWLWMVVSVPLYSAVPLWLLPRADIYYLLICRVSVIKEQKHSSPLWSSKPTEFP